MPYAYSHDPAIAEAAVAFHVRDLALVLIATPRPNTCICVNVSSRERAMAVEDVCDHEGDPQYGNGF